MKKLMRLTYIVLLFLAFSCTDDITSLNVNPKAYTSAQGATFMSNAQRALVNAMTSANVNSGIFRLLSQQWAETQYPDESQYNITKRAVPDNFWATMYRDALRDFAEGKKLISEDKTPGFNAAPQLAVIDVLEVYIYSVLVDTFGDIPYKEALDHSNLYPEYEDAAAIYGDLLTRLDADIAALQNVASLGFPAGQDLIYNGDGVKWLRFANSLKLRLGMSIVDADLAKAKAAVEEAVVTLQGGVFTSNTDNAKLTYLVDPPNTNPVWVDLVQSNRGDFVAANTIVDRMNALSDPRRVQFFTLDENGDYKGGIYGAESGVNSHAKLSKPSVKLTVQTFPGVLMDYAEVEFYLAEAAARGFSVTGSAEEHYNAAIEASILDWGGTDVEAIAYLANPMVAYATAAGDYKEKIGTQKWIALYNRGLEAWTEWRRLDYPALVKPATAFSDIPLRFTYPVNEQNLNKENYNTASAKLGGDDVRAKIFWDKN